MRAFLCAIDELVWDSIENGYVRPTTPKSEWDKAALAMENANSKAINAIFYGVFTDEFQRISHVETAKEAWMILETTYEGTKKVKDTKLQMLTNISNIKYFIFNLSLFFLYISFFLFFSISLLSKCISDWDNFENSLSLSYLKVCLVGIILKMMKK